MTLSESSEEFKVFNQPPSSEDISADIDSQQQVDITTFDEMGIQRKNQRSLMDLIESQPERDALGKFAQPKLPPPPPKEMHWEILSYSQRRDPESCKVAKD